MGLRIQQGLRFKRSYRFQKFNYATGQIEQIDTGGHHYEFSVFQPPEFELVLTNNATGETVKGSVTLSAEDSILYRSLTSEDDRKVFEATVLPKYASEVLKLTVRR